MVSNELFRRSAQAWSDWMLPMSWQVAILFAAIWVLCLMARNASPRLRYALWCLVLIKLCLPPSFAFVTGIGRWLPARPPCHSIAPKPGSEAVETVAPPIVAREPVDPVFVVTQPVGAGPVLTSREAAAVTEPSASRIDWPALVFTVWSDGVLVMAGLLALAYVRTYRQLSAALAVDEAPIVGVLNQARADLGIQREVRVLAADGLASPILFGLLHPRIALPVSGAHDLSLAELRPIFLHELAHLRRRDLWVNWLQAVLQTLYWFHPLVWYANLRLRRERELIVDDVVLAHLGDRPSTYGDSLLSVVKQAAKQRLLAPGYVGIVETRSSIKHRVRRILDPRHRVSLKLGWVSIVVLAVAGIVLIPQARPAEGPKSGRSSEPRRPPARKTASGSAQPAKAASGGVTKRVYPAAAPETRPRTAPIIDLKPPFAFRIEVMTPDGRPQPGVQIRCYHPRDVEDGLLVDTTATSDERGVAAFKVTKADLRRDRYIWFSLADQNFVGTGGGGLSPLDGDMETAFYVLPAKEYRVRVVDEDGHPIPNAVVSLDSDRKATPKEFRADARARTGPDGTAVLRFADVAASVGVRSRKHIDSFTRGIVLPDKEPYEVVLREGETVVGDVVDQQGRPMKSVRLLVAKERAPGRFSDWFTCRWVTDRQGCFAISGFASGTYVIQAEPQNPSLPVFFEPARVSVTEGQPPAPVELIASPGAVLKGRYRSRHGIRLFRRVEGLHSHHPKRPSRYVETQKDGSFVVSGIPPKTEGVIYLVGASRCGQVVKIPEDCPFFRVEDMYTVRFKDVPPGVYSGVEVRILSPGRKDGSGRVYGRLTDLSGEPISGLKVVAVPDGFAQETGEDGRYAGEVATARATVLEVQSPRIKETVYRSGPFELHDGDVVERNITIARGVARRATAEPTNTLSGRVVVGDGKGVAGAVVCLGNTGVITAAVSRRGRVVRRPSDLPTWRRGIDDPAYVRTASDGSFSFDRLLPGTTDIWAEHPRHGRAWLRDVASSADRVEIVLARQSDTTTFTGSVESVDGKPCANAWIGLLTEPDAVVAQSTTDGRGQFAVQARLRWERFQYLKLLCVPKSGPIVWKVLPYCSGDGVRLRAQKEATIKGRVLGPASEPMEKATVRVQRVADVQAGTIVFTEAMKRYAPTTETDSQGRFTLRQLPAQTDVTLAVNHPSCQERFLRFPVNGDRSEIAPVHLAAAAPTRTERSPSKAPRRGSGNMPSAWIYFESREVYNGQPPQLELDLDTGKQVRRAYNDTVLISYLANRAWGHHRNLSISMSDTNRSLLSFPLRSLAPGSRLEKASLVLNMKLSQIPPVEAFDLAVHIVRTGWDEASARWNNQPGFDPKPVVAATVEPRAGTVRIDVTEIVKQWLDGTAPNHGILLKVATPIGGGPGAALRRGDGRIPELTVPHAEEQYEKLPWPHQPPGLDAEQVRRLNEEVWVINDFPLYQADREGKRRYFHGGLDIVLENGTKIYAMKDGWVKSVRFSTITIGDAEGDEPCYGWEYSHLADFQVEVGDFVKKGTWIGEVRFRGLAHIHLTRVFSEGAHWGMWRHLCCPNGHFTYTDDESPVIEKPFHFFENGSDTSIEPSASGEVVLSGDVDIVVGMREAGLYARSNKTGFGDRLAVTKIDYEIRPVSGKAGAAHRYHSFDFRNTRIKCGASAREHNTGLTKVVFKHWTRFEPRRRIWSRVPSYYIITNSPGKPSPTELKLSDREHCWRTAATDETGKPLFPDGEYDIVVTASDFVGNRVTETMRVRVANPR